MASTMKFTFIMAMLASLAVATVVAAPEAGEGVSATALQQPNLRATGAAREQPVGEEHKFYGSCGMCLAYLVR